MRFSSFFIKFIGSVLFAGFVNSALAANYSVNNIAYDFDDIAGSGMVILEDCDDCARAIDIGFEFTYYGRSYSRLYVSSNGIVLPGVHSPIFFIQSSLVETIDRTGCCIGRELPYDDNFDGVLALWWNDLSLKSQKSSSAKEENGKVLFELKGVEGERELIVQYDKVRHFFNLETDAANTFQLKIFEADNRIEYHYKKIVATPTIHSIGIESPRGNSGIQYFRTSGKNKLPPKSSEFAISFTPPEEIKLTSSLRYAAAGNTFEHEFKVGDSAIDLNDFEFSNVVSDNNVVETIDIANPELLDDDPAGFSLKYKLFLSQSDTSGGSVHGDYIDFTVNGGETLTLDSQTIFIQQLKVLDNDEFSVRGTAINHNGTLASYKSKNNLLELTLKNENVDDIFFFGRDPDTQQPEAYQLTELETNQDCGPIFIENTPGEQEAYLYSMCHRVGSTTEVSVRKFDLQSYLDDDKEKSETEIADTIHTFSGDIGQNGWVVAANGKIAYVRDADEGGVGLEQHVYFDGAQISTVSGTVESLSIDDSGSKLVYVIDGIAYFYNGTQTVIDSQVSGSATLSRDGSVLAFASSSDLASNNGDASVEVFTHQAQTPFGAFEQMTHLPASGECKLPQLSEHATRLLLVCNDDLLDLGNNFTEPREAVFVIENLTGENITHLITGEGNGVEQISSLVMSSDGAVVSFQDEEEDNAYQLVGLGKLDSLTEEITPKDYPEAFKLSGDGKSGAVFYLLALMAFLSFSRIFKVLL